MAEVLGTDPGPGVSGNGATFNGSSSGAIGMITQINIPGVMAGDLDVATMNTGPYLQFIASKIDPQTIELTLLYQRVNMAKILSLVGAAREMWTIAIPDGGGSNVSTYSQLGYFKSLGAAIPQNERITQTATLRMSGAPTFTPAT